MLTNIVDCDLEFIRIGLPVRATFRPVEDRGIVAMFVPVETDAPPA
jgi:hypothetical protein